MDDGGVADGVGLGVGGGGGGSDVASFHALEDGYGGMRLGGFGVVLGVLGLVLGGGCVGMEESVVGGHVRVDCGCG